MTPFFTGKTAENGEISMPSFPCYVQAGKLKSKDVIGRSQLFSTADLRKLKQKLDQKQLYRAIS